MGCVYKQIISVTKFKKYPVRRRMMAADMWGYVTIGV